MYENFTACYDEIKANTFLSYFAKMSVKTSDKTFRFYN